MTDKIQEIVNNSKQILVLQADNPDGDSLSSALALENILGNLGKDIVMYCGVDIPGYLKYMDGWDRVVNRLPSSFDACIIVDSPSLTLFDSLTKNNQLSWLKSKPCIVLDHHHTKTEIDFADAVFSPRAVSTTEVIYKLANQLDWAIDNLSAQFIVFGLMSDSLGLTTDEVTPSSIRAVADMVEIGVNMAELDSKRKKLQKKSTRILKYKGELLQRVEYYLDNKIAVVNIPWSEIEKYSWEYNPAMLVIDEMRQVEGVVLSVVFKTYPSGRVTAKLRTNFGWPIASDIAEAFGGGGHKFASGFRVEKSKSLEEVRDKFLEISSQTIKRQEKNENI